ncbi:MULTISPECIES: DUF3293 domain-containing protein [Brevundimonas]|uniref:DUF3293 domain-containing protein n=1 Tax=Brevundimonas TaxID=41275 RepID=UPI0025BE10C9|nr:MULTISPECIES: DUF3293 domain-containing protein [Brevundimonas]
MRRSHLEQRITGLIDTGLVCPEPKAWHRLWLNITALAEGPVPLPLILAAWHTTSDVEKTKRLVEQLSIADRQGLGDAIGEAIAAIPQNEWRRRRASGAVEVDHRTIRYADTKLEQALIDAFRETDFVIFGQPELVITVGTHSAAFDALMRWYGVDQAAYVTAYNPYSQARSDGENNQAQDALKATLNTNCLTWLEGEGRGRVGDWPPEPSLAVLGIPKAQACDLGCAFEQNAIVWCARGQPAELLLLR